MLMDIDWRKQPSPVEWGMRNQENFDHPQGIQTSTVYRLGLLFGFTVIVSLVSGLSHELDEIFGLTLTFPAATNPILCVITPYSQRCFGRARSIIIFCFKE